MECNKDEALRSIQIAETRMQSNDFAGALRFAQKAQRLYPQLENIAQMLAVCEVHCAGEKKLGSEADWYAVLKIETAADETTIKKQYKKLALLLHPDKNKFSGSEAAFKLIGEANRILADKAKRSLYDVKRKGSATVTNQSPAAHQSTTSQNTSSQSEANVKPGNASSSENPDGSQHQQANDKDKAFWTMCPSCKMKFQYLGRFLHKALVCQNCKKCFIAFKLDAFWKTAGPQNHQKDVPNNQNHQKDVPNYGGSSKDNSSRNHPSKSKCDTGSDGGADGQANVKVNTHTTPENKGRGIPKTGQTEVKLENPDGNQQAEEKAFWTICPLCKVKYEYSSLFLHKALICHLCKKPFIAFKLDASGKTVRPQKASTPKKGAPNGDHSRNHASKSKCDAGSDGGAKVQANVKVNMHTKPENEGRGIPKTSPTKVKPKNPDGSQHQQAENKVFQTMCPFCRVVQYSSLFLHNCQNCKKSFLAVKLDASGKTACSQKTSTPPKDVPNGGSSKDNHCINHPSKSKFDTGGVGGTKVQANGKLNMNTKPEINGRGIPKADPTKVKPQDKGKMKSGSEKRGSNCGNSQKVIPNGGSLKDNQGRSNMSKMKCDTGSNGGAKVQADRKVHMHAKPENKGRGVPKADPMKVKPQEKGDTKSGSKKRRRDCTTDSDVKRRRGAL